MRLDGYDWDKPAYRRLFRLSILCFFSVQPIRLLATVIASIPPLTLIAAELCEGITDVGRPLIHPGQSPHHAELLLKDMRDLSRAQIIFWIGPEAEQGLAPVLEAMACSAIALGQRPAVREWALTHPPHREEGNCSCHPRTPVNLQSSTEKKLGERNLDWHLWCAPEAAALMAKEMVWVLEAHYPQHSEKLQTNLLRFMDSLAHFSTHWNGKFKGLKISPYGITHPSLHHLGESLALAKPVNLQMPESGGISLYRLHLWHKTLTQTPIKVLFLELGQHEALPSKLQRLHSFKLVCLDTLGHHYVDLSNPAGRYAAWLDAMAHTLYRHLVEPSVPFQLD